jgi:MFS transporter, ACS family, D-galactonate transporter
MMFFGLLTWGPSYLADARDLDLKQIGAATFVIFLAGALGSLTSGFLADALQRRGHGRRVVLRSLLGASGAGAIAGFALLPHVGDPLSAVALLAATAFLLLWGSLYWSFPAMLAPRDRVGLVGGVMNFAGSASGIAVPIVTGVILDVTGAYLVVLYFFAGCAALYVTGSFLIDFGRRAR